MVHHDPQTINSRNTNDNDDDNSSNNFNVQLAHKCEKCGLIFSRKYKLEQHKRVKHQHRCETCLKLCSTAQALKRHELTHVVSNHQCKTCLKIYSQDDTLRAHEVSMHQNKTKEMGFQEEDIVINRHCKYCLHTFYFADQLRKKQLGLPHDIPQNIPTVSDKARQPYHMILLMNGQAHHQCTICFEVIRSCGDNLGHYRKHGYTTLPKTKAFQCKSCLKLFNTRKSQQRHELKSCPRPSDDPNDDPFSSPNRCEWCLKLYGKGKSFERHLKLHPVSTSPTDSLYRKRRAERLAKQAQ